MKRFAALIVSFSFGLCTVLGQTINTGEVTISENTIFSTVSDFDNTSTGSLINNGDLYIYGNWNNDGVVDFDPVILGSTNGLTRFVGNSIQTLSGSEMSFFNNVLFDNSSSQYAFELSGDISVSSEVNYSQGIVDNDNFGGTFQIEQDGIDVNTSDVSHVDGPVLKIGDQSFTYPIGDSGFYRPSSISAPDFNTDQYTSKYFFEPTNNNYSTNNLSGNLILVDDSEHWEIRQDVGNSNLIITLSWNESTTPPELLTEPLENLTIAYWNPANQNWESISSTVDSVNQTVTTIVEITNYGIFTLGRIRSATVLPCSLNIVNTLITPNDDGLNDFFEILNPNTSDSNCLNNISVKVFNRFGVKVFDANDYGENGNVFNGKSDGRLTINEGSDTLPSGTYYYVLEVNYNNSLSNSITFEKVDYLYINSDN